MSARHLVSVGARRGAVHRYTRKSYRRYARFAFERRRERRSFALAVGISGR
jgi:hypothetical protein